jgi:GNAT superfamily N-acetyltransferase
MTSFDMTISHDLIVAPWVMRVCSNQFLVRTLGSDDLAAVALMHSRCSARSLLGRYRRGGAAPTVAALDLELRKPYGFAAIGRDGEVAAVGTVRHDPQHSEQCAEIGLLVEDRWQRKGIGAQFAAHLAAVATLRGFQHLIAYHATALDPARRLMTDIGPVRLVFAPQPHLHTALPRSAELGLGVVRQRLAS